MPIVMMTIARAETAATRMMTTAEMMDMEERVKTNILREMTGEGTQTLSLPQHLHLAALFRGIVVQVLSEPSLNFSHAHSLAFAVIGNLIAVNFAKTEISRFRVCEVQAAHTRSGPHRK